MADRLVDDYLRRLADATDDLAPDVRDDLLVDVRAHLEEAERDAVDEADLRNRIERLGSPESIAAEARGGAPPLPPPPVPTSSSRRDGLALVLLVLGAPLGALVFFFVWPLGALLGWGTGLYLLWTSTSWVFRERLLGTLVWPGGLLTPLALGVVGGRTCYGAVEVIDGVEQVTNEVCQGFALPIWAGIPAMIAVFAAPLVVAVFLGRRADARRAGHVTR